MASAPQPRLPLFFNDLMPLNSRDHKNWKSTQFTNLDFLGKTHAVPVTVDEFVDAQRHFPIVFSSGDNPVPLALMGLNEGVNSFVDDAGMVTENVYMPAYVRRYPFMLARLNPDSDELSLCFDPSAGVIGDFPEGNALFEGEGEPSEFTKGVLDFCQKFEESGARTKAFMDEVVELDLLMEGEIAITMQDNPDKPFIYRGFKMIDETKLRELPIESVEGLHRSGMMMLLHAHLFSMNLMRVIFGRQSQQGKVPAQQADA
ncbi:SapC family protein [Altererythrobacter sp. Z27]|uniref:SapC family protein n=1 Tax=Altererythrobacter sp. Z27 TaxID=3461147 RepID=UPI004043FA14